MSTTDELEVGPRLRSLLASLKDSLEEQAARLAATQSSLSPAAVVALTVDRVRSHLNVALSDYAREQNERVQTLTARLPAELLCEVFAHLSLADRIATSHVSQRWRKVSLDAAALLWSEIRSYDQRAGILRERLARVPTGVALTLAAYARRKGTQDVLSALQTRMSDFRSLYLRILGDYLPHDIPPWIAALSQAAPNLERFHLTCNELSTAFQQGNLQLLGNSAPRLRRLRFYGSADVLQGWAPGANVRSLLFSQRGFTSRHELCMILESFPNLEELGLEVDDWNQPVAGEAAPLALPPCLRLLIVSVDYGIDTRDVLRCLDHAAPATLVVCGSNGSLTPRDLPGVVSDVLSGGERVESVKCLIAIQDTRAALKENMVVIRSRGPHGRARWFVDVQLLICVTALETFGSLTQLTLSETLLTSALAFGPYTLASLATLVIALMVPNLQAEWGQHSVFLASHDEGPVLMCPALDALVFAGNRGCTTTLAPEMLRAVVERCIQSPPTRALGLCHAAVLEGNFPQVMELLACVRDIRRYDAAELDVYDGRVESTFHDLMSWHPKL